MFYTTVGRFLSYFIRTNVSETRGTRAWTKGDSDKRGLRLKGTHTRWGGLVLGLDNRDLDSDSDSDNRHSTTALSNKLNIF